MKRISKKQIIILVIAAILIAVAIPTTVYGYNTYEYNKYYNEALTDIKGDNFETAVNNLNKALSYKSKYKGEINKKLALIDVLKTSKESYENGIKLLSEKKYLDAIEMFNKVAAEDDSRYSITKDKVAECKDSFIKENLENAKAKAKDQNYEEALKYLDTIVAFDKNNEEAGKLKSDYMAAIQKQKDDAAAKKAAEDAAKQAAQSTAKPKQTTTTPSTPSAPSTPSVPSTGISSSVSDGKLIITDNGKSMAFDFQHFSVFNGVLKFNIFANYTDFFSSGLNNSTFDYSAIFHVGDQTVNVKGKTVIGPGKYDSVSFDYIPDDNKGSVDISITYKGKVYTFTKEFFFNSKD